MLSYLDIIITAVMNIKIIITTKYFIVKYIFYMHTVVHKALSEI